MIIEALLVAIVVLIGAVFLLMGAALTKGGIEQVGTRWIAFFSALESRGWASTTGKVTRAVVKYATTRRGRTFTPAVRYTYGVGGEPFTSERYAFAETEGAANAQAVVERFRAGSNVEVFYDPKAPKRSTLDRSVPPVVGPTLGWLLLLLVGGSVMFFLGVTIVRGPFEDPPDLGETPSLAAQLGGLGAAVGGLFLLVAGIRAASADERRQRQLLRRLESVKPSLASEVRAGELAVVSGRAEELGDATKLPFDDAPLVYYDVDVEWFRRTSFDLFEVHDASGDVLVEIRATESTLLKTERLRIEGEVERWLDETRDSNDDPISAHPEWIRFERIRSGDPVLVFGRAESEDGELIFRAREGDPTSLLVADGSREEIALRLRKKIGKTRALAFLGGGLFALGAAAMAAPFP